MFGLSADVPSRLFWGKGEDLSTVPQPGLSQQPVNVHKTPLVSSVGMGGEERSGKGDASLSQSTQDHISASYRTKPQEHTHSPT